MLWLKVGEQKKEVWQGTADGTVSPSSKAEKKRVSTNEGVGARNRKL